MRIPITGLSINVLCLCVFVFVVGRQWQHVHRLSKIDRSRQKHREVTERGVGETSDGLEEACDASLLAGAGGSVEEEVGEAVRF